MVASICPYLDLAGAPAPGPAPGRRCRRLNPPFVVDEVHQGVFCLAADHVHCAVYTSPQAAESQASEDAEEPPASNLSRALLARLPWIALGLVVVLIAATLGRNLLRSAPAPAATAPAVAGVASVVPTATHTPLPVETAPSATSGPGAARMATPSPVPGGSIVALQPQAGGSGWWAGSERLAEHLGDSFLYAGYFNGQPTLSAVQFDLRRVRRGAPILDAQLLLTGLSEERLNRGAGGIWSVQVLASGALQDLARVDFQSLYFAPAASTLVPTALHPADLGAGQQTVLTFDADARAWLEKQVLDGVPTVVFRLVGPGGGEETLFAWDSGTGPATRGNGPQLVLSLGAAPATPPPLATVPMIVATLTPTPANVLTAAAHAWAATAVAAAVGTGTPPAYLIVTPTPPAQNLATAQALAYALGLPPLVVYTPTPANAATATMNALHATAVAATTGTFTPVPANAVTPVIVLPTPVPGNAATALAQVLTATAQVQQFGTETPRPPNVLVATTTPTPAEPTATPANQQTAVMQAAAATLTAMAVSTQQPTPPPNTVTPTPGPTGSPLPTAAPAPGPTSTPSPTASLTPGPEPLPTETPTATPTATTIASSLEGLILFRSDREGDARVYALDPDTGSVTRLATEDPFLAALALEGRAPDGFGQVWVEQPDGGAPQLYVRDSRSPGGRQLTTTTGGNYDPAWSPREDLIAFVSQEPGNDEIYTVRPDGSFLERLTVSVWSWDKHPSWSPDGTRIVFWSNRETGRSQLWIMDWDGRNQRRLLDSPHNDWDPVWVK